MNIQRPVKYLAPFAIIGIIAVFIYNIYQHGWVDDPGKVIYKAQCAKCHGEAGEGIKTLVPPLSNDDYAPHNFDSIPCWLKNGLNHAIKVGGKTYDQPMYPNGLDEIQTANVINFLNREFFASDKKINSQWVRERWKGCR